MMNKRGGLVLRDVLFMLITFSAILALGSVYVNYMANEYSNTNMISEYDNTKVNSLGDKLLFGNVSSMIDVQERNMGNESDSVIGSWTTSTGFYGGIAGAGAILVSILKAPIYVGNAVAIILNAFLIPTIVSKIISTMIVFLIYGLIVFVIISALLKGGKI